MEASIWEIMLIVIIWLVGVGIINGIFEACNIFAMIVTMFWPFVLLVLPFVGISVLAEKITILIRRKIDKRHENRSA